MTSGQAELEPKGTKEESYLSAPLDPSRVLPGSRVNFDRLSDEEMTQRYMNRLNELKELRSTYQKMIENQKPDRSEDTPQPHVSPWLRSLKMARDLLREREFELPDCSFVLDTLARGVGEGTLGPRSHEFELICGIIKGVMSKNGNPGCKRVSSKLESVLRSSSKGELFDFATKAGTQLKVEEGKDNQSLLQARSSQFLLPQHVAPQQG